MEKNNNHNQPAKDDHIWLVVWNMTFIFHFIYGMSSFPLTYIFFKMVIAPPTRYLLCTFFPDDQRLTGFFFAGIYAISAPQVPQVPVPVSPKKTRRPLMLATKSTAGATTELVDLGALGPWQLENHPIPKKQGDSIAFTIWLWLTMANIAMENHHFKICLISKPR